MRIIETRSAPNPRRVRIFLAEKGIAIPYDERDLMAGDLKSEDFTRLNPLQRVPILALDDGRCICETVAICRYFEELQPYPPLFGVDAFDKATVEMWQRRIELGLFNHIAQAFRHLHPKMAHLELPQVPAWGEINKPKAEAAMRALDEHLSANPFVAGKRYSIADITAFVALDFVKPAKITIPEGLPHLMRWYADVARRPSASA